jgi:hypothetical protein
LPTKRCSVPLAQIDLIIGAAEAEPHRLIRRASIKIVVEFDGYPLGHPGLPDCDRLFVPYRQINCQAEIIATPPVALHAARDDRMPSPIVRGR